MTNKQNHIPDFASEQDEKAFWESHDSTEYVDLNKAKRVILPKLKLPSTAISLRLPVGLLDRIKVAANKRNVPYQSLIKTWLSEKLET